jgi:predicted dehydrogenase
MSASVRVGLVGISGYGESYLNALLDDPQDNNFELVAVADPNPRRCSRVDQLRRQGVAFYTSIDGVTAECNIDLLMLATPLHMHASHIQKARNAGLSVLCEKPLAATFDQARELAILDAAAPQISPNSFVAIGFQWSFSSAMEALKRDVMRGDFGAPIRLKSIALYPRAESYYSRNDWAGKKYSPSGAPVFDSPVNNATSHFLHAMFYVLGAEREQSAMPIRLTAETYRANAIETFDCCALRAFTSGGTEILFYTAHCIGKKMGPAFQYEFERGSVEYSDATHDIVARFDDGRTKSYGDPSDVPMRKIWSCMDAVRTGQPVACGIAATLPHALCANAAYGSHSTVHSIPNQLLRRIGSGGEAILAVDELDLALADCYERGVLPSESGNARLAWARHGQEVDLQTPRWSVWPSNEQAIEALSA